MERLELGQFPVVAAGAWATLVTNDLLDKSVHALFWEMGGTFVKADIEEIRLRVDGKDICEAISGAQLQSMNSYLGLSDTTNYIGFFFGDPTAQTKRGQHLGDLDLSIYRKPIEINIKLGAAPLAPTLQTYAIAGAPKLAMGIGFNDAEARTIRALVRTIIQPAGAVNKKAYEVGLGSEFGARLRCLQFFNVTLTSVEFKKGGFVKHDNLSAAANNYIEDEFARVPQAGLYSLDFIVDGSQGEAEETIDKNGAAWPMQIKITTTAADTIDCYADIYTGLYML